MPDPKSAPTEAELIRFFEDRVSIKNVTLGVRLKRTIRAGDNYTTVEAHREWQMDMGEGVAMGVGHFVQYSEARAMKALYKRTLFDLYAGGVLTTIELKDHIAEFDRLYEALMKRPEGKDDKGTSAGNLSRTGESGGPSGERSDSGANVSPGEDGGLPARSGPDWNASFGSESGFLEGASGAASSEDSVHSSEISGTDSDPG